MITIIFLREALIFVLLTCFAISGPELIGEFKHQVEFMITQLHEETAPEVEKGPHTHTEAYETNDLFSLVKNTYLDFVVAPIRKLVKTNRDLLPILSDDCMRYFETFVCERV